MRIKREYLILTVILLLGFFVRIYLFKNEIFVQSDTVHYSHLGKNLIESGKYVYGENFNWGIYYPPGYPIFIGLINLIINNLFFSAKLVSLLSGMITVLLFYLIGKEIYDEESGLFAAFAFAVHPAIPRISILGQSEALFYCFLFLGIYLFILLVRKDNFILYVLLGISIALSYMTKPEGLLLLIFPFLHLFGLFDEKLKFGKNRVLKVVLLTGIVIIMSMPYVLFLKETTGRFALTGKKDTILLSREIEGGRKLVESLRYPGNPIEKKIFSLNDNKDQAKGFEMRSQMSIMEYIFEDPPWLIRKYIQNVFEQVKILIKFFMPIILPLFFTFFKKDLFKDKTRLLFLAFPLFYFALYPLFVIEERYMIIILLFFILYGSAGFAGSTPAFFRLMEFYGVKTNRAVSFAGKNIKYLIIIIFLLGALVHSGFSNILRARGPVEHAEAGHYLKNNVMSEYEKLNIMSRKPFVSFYSDSRFTMLPYANSADTVNFAKLYNVDYIVVDERYLSKWEFYGELIELDRHSEEVESVYEDSADKLIKLFKIK